MEPEEALMKVVLPLVRDLSSEELEALAQRIKDNLPDVGDEHVREFLNQLGIRNNGSAAFAARRTLANTLITLAILGQCLGSSERQNAA